KRRHLMSRNSLSPKRHPQIFRIILIAIASISLCAGSFGVKALFDRRDIIEIIDRTDSDILQRTEVTRYYYKLAWHHMDEIADISNQMSIPEILQTMTGFDSWLPNFRALLDEKGDKATITSEQVRYLSEHLQLLIDRGSPSLRKNLNKELERLQLSEFVGMTMTEAWTHLHKIWSDDDPTVLPFSNDPEDLLPLPAGELMTEEPYGPYWRVHRDNGSDFAFAYPSDWTVYGQMIYPHERRRMKICNYDERHFVPDTWKSDVYCYFLEVVQTVKTDLPLATVAYDTFCTNQSVMTCGKISFSEATAKHPERVEFEFHRNDLPYRGFSMVVYRTESGALLKFSTRTSKENFEFNAIIDSTVLTSDSRVQTPDTMAWDAQPRGPLPREPRDLRAAPSNTPTPWPTPIPRSFWTPQSTLEGGEYAHYWAEFRDIEDGYGFAYPADWYLSSQPDAEVVDKYMQVCNNNLLSYRWDDILRVCVGIEEQTGIDPSLPLDQAAKAVLCQYPASSECGKTILLPETGGKPARVILPIKILYEEPQRMIIFIVFRISNGKLFIFSSSDREMSALEIQAILESFVLGNDTPIIPPEFTPSTAIIFPEE
ncbi:MAG: hypothetical protein WBM17_16925, partial [Anaerolineales bacterium]